MTTGMTIRLENMESLESPATFEAAHSELETLAAALRAEGLDAYVAGADEPFHAHLQESAEQAFVDVLNLVFEHAIDVTLMLAAERILRRWARRRRHFRDREGARATAYLWGPDGDIIKVIELPEPDELSHTIDGA
jgi:hypothetical protein